MFGGDIGGQGPRYCPSIEDKVVRFADKDHHLLFVEPDGVDTSEVYLQGFSSSMPPELQDRDGADPAPASARAEVQRYAYAVEYDALDPTQLDVSMMSKVLPGLFSAGQLNGTSGYEEAAAQGLIAGVNAARRAAATAGGRPCAAMRATSASCSTTSSGGGSTSRTACSPHATSIDSCTARTTPTTRLAGLGHAWGLVDERALGGGAVDSEARVQSEVVSLDASRETGAIWRPRSCAAQERDYAKRGPRASARRPTPLSDAEAARVEVLVRYAAYIERSQRELAARARFETWSIQDVAYEDVPELVVGRAGGVGPRASRRPSAPRSACAVSAIPTCQRAARST
jgi:tRNA uridine 5-carboxymethylaminomethyl modification enzyme